MIDCKYPIISICGKKGSGKSSLIYALIKIFALIKNPGVNIHIFCWWINRDPIYKKIKEKYWNYKHVNINMHTDLIEGKNQILNDIIDEIINTMGNPP